MSVLHTNLAAQSSRNTYVTRYFEIPRQGKAYNSVSSSLVVCIKLARDGELQWNKYIHAVLYPNASGGALSGLYSFYAHIRITELIALMAIDALTAFLITWTFTSQVSFVLCSPLWFLFTSFGLCIILRLNK